MISVSPESLSRRAILRRRNASAALRLFCFCYAGGNASIYLPWQAQLGHAIEVCAVQLPGRGGRFDEPLLSDIPSAVRSIRTAIAPLLDRPFAFFGHSLGSLLAYEVAQDLLASGEALPRHLIASGSTAPHMRKFDRALHLLDDRELTAELERYAGTPVQVLENPDLLTLVLPIVRADFRLAIEYRPSERPPLPIPLSVFAGRDDDVDDVREYEGWFDLSRIRGELTWFDGGHFFINSATPQVLSRLRAILDPIAHSLSHAVPTTDSLFHKPPTIA